MHYISELCAIEGCRKEFVDWFIEIGDVVGICGGIVSKITERIASDYGHLRSVDLGFKMWCYEDGGNGFDHIE